MKSPIRFIFAPLLLVAMLVLTGCPAQTPIQKLKVAISAIETGLPIVGAFTGAPPELITNIVRWLSEANEALDQSAVILAGSGSDAQKAARITATFAAIVRPEVPAKYQPLADVVSTVATDIAAFLAVYQTAPGTGLKVVAPKFTPVAAGDMAALQAVREKAARNAATLSKLK